MSKIRKDNDAKQEKLRQSITTDDLTPEQPQAFITLYE